MYPVPEPALPELPPELPVEPEPAEPEEPLEDILMIDGSVVEKFLLVVGFWASVVELQFVVTRRRRRERGAEWAFLLTLVRCFLLFVPAFTKHAPYYCGVSCMRDLRKARAWSRDVLHCHVWLP